jgi:hypothetical protein
MKESYGTLSETINALKKEGYTMDFNIREAYGIHHQADMILSPDDFKIDKVYRFEGATNPDDQSILCNFFTKVWHKRIAGKWIWNFVRRDSQYIN